MTDIRQRRSDMILGSFVADAATMGFHWLYDQDRIRQLAPNQPEFRAPTAADFEGTAGYFAHAKRRKGDLSQYGEQALVMLRSLEDAGRYSRTNYQNLFREHFGYGGDYVGYIDRPTRDTLNAITQIEQDVLVRSRAIVSNSDDQTDNMTPEAYVYPGADDMQLPAISKLPALVARHYDAENLFEMVEDAVRVTNNSDVAVRFGRIATKLLLGCLKTGALPDLTTLAQEAAPDVAAAILPVLARISESTQTITADIGMSCNLDLGVPSLFHNLATANSYVDAVRANIYAGGDSCGRSIVLGAALGALHGCGGKGIPNGWRDELLVKDAVMSTSNAVLC